MKFHKKIIILLLIITPLFTTYSCKTGNVSTKEKQINRERQRKKKNDTVLYQKALKRHMKLQSKETQKNMKRDFRTARRNSEYKREFFLKRWLKSKFWYRPEKQKG